MLTSQFLTAWFMVMFPLVYSPGPANTLFASNGGQYGFRKSIPFMVGLDIAFVIQSVVVGLGIGGLLARFPQAFMLLRYAGIAYIAYLGFTFLKAALKEKHEQPECLNFWNGMIVTAINPKAWVMQLMMFSQFMDNGAGWLNSVANLTLLLSALNITGHVVWILFGSVLLSRSTTGFNPRMQNGMYSAMLFGSIYFLI